MQSDPYIIAGVSDAPDLAILGLGDNELLQCVYTSNCVIDANNHSFDANSLYHHTLHQGIIPRINILIHPPVTNDNNTNFNPSSPFHTFEFSTNSGIGSVVIHGTQIYDEMTYLATERPGSPPELTGSKSSKSSSFRSSTLSGADSILTNLTNFEDISLRTEIEFPFPNFKCYDHPKRPLSRNASTMSGSVGTMSASIISPHSLGGTRGLTNGVRRPSYPNLEVETRASNKNVSIQSLGLPQGGSKRGFSSSSTPTLAMKAMSNLSRSRSPSPSNPNGAISPRLKPKSPSFNGVPGFRAPVAKRRSWQPSQKSVKELEDEYDDLDEDLPEDASLWNVPLSPRPPLERASSTATNSSNVSPNTSPERNSPLRSPLSNVQMAHEVSPPVSPATQTSEARRGSYGPMPSSAQKPSIPRGSSIWSLPNNYYFPKSRAKTWDAALSELSEEAKFLTEALENHASNLELQKIASSQNGTLPGKIGIEKLARSKSNPIELPPLRVSDVLIDPLPVSKEKEKVLSRTRPSWLPPKNRKEERKHLKEYQHMMEMSRESEKRKAAKAVVVQCAQDDTKSALLRIWEEHVLPNWDQVIREPRTRELWWRGVALRSRGEVWQRAIGNELVLTEITYNKALQRAKDMETRIAIARSDEHIKEGAWFAAIRRDLQSVFPDLKIFQHSSSLQDGLIDVLMAYTMYRSDVGYSHGTHFLAAILVLTLPTPQASFLALANLLNRPIPLALLTRDPTSTQTAYALTCALLARKLPRLHTHLFSPLPHGLALDPAEIFEPIMRTLFLAPGGGVGLEAAVRIWDVIVFEGDDALVRGVVGVFSALESQLHTSREEVLELLGWQGKGFHAAVQAAGGVEKFMARLREAGNEDDHPNSASNTTASAAKSFQATPTQTNKS